MLLFEKNRLSFPYCFLQIFVGGGGGQGLDGGGQSCDKESLRIAFAFEF